MLRAIFALALVISPCIANAENLQGIEWMDSLDDVKRKFPNASLTVEKPAWLRAEQAAFTLRGSGLPGTIFMVFDDGRPMLKRMGEEAEGAAKASYERAASRADGEALSIDWIRWVPESSIPLARLKTLYGQQPVCTVSSTSMRPICNWPLRALQANLADDEKAVLSIETDYTAAEKRSVWRRRYKDADLPSWLKN